MKVSIVLPTYNRLARLQQVVHALEQQDYPLELCEWVIVSDGSSDGTNEYLHALKSRCQVTPLIQSNQGPAAARNQGVSLATGELILFLDDDVIPAPQLVSEHVAWHQRFARAVVIGPMLTPPGYRPSPWIRWMHDRLAEQYQAMRLHEWQPTARQFYTGNASIKKQFLVECGGFDPAYKRAEDVELAYRLAARGLCFAFNPKAIGYHYEERSFSAWVSIPYAYGSNDVRFSREKGQQWLLETIREEFTSRHPVIKRMVGLCIDRNHLSAGIIWCCKLLGSFGAWSGVELMQRFAFSSIFNLRYYQGISDALGGKTNLQSLRLLQ